MISVASYLFRPPIVAIFYSSETWILTIKYENNLRIFERQMLRKLRMLRILLILTMYAEYEITWRLIT